MSQFFSKSIYRNTLRRYWAGGALLGVVATLTAIMYHNSLRQSQSYYHPSALRYDAGAGMLNQSTLISFGLIVAAAGVVCALLVFSYMQDKRAVVAMHALPVRREAHFCSVFLGGLTLLWGAIVLFILEIAFVQMVCWTFYFPPLGMLLVLLLICSLVAYSVTVLAGFLTGSSIGQFVITALLAALPLLLEQFFNQLCNAYLFGYSGVTRLNETLHPFFLFGKLAQRASWWMAGVNYREYDVQWSSEIGHFAVPLGDVGLIFALLGYCAAAIAASVLLCRKRRLECAGDFIAVRGMRPVFRYGSAFLLAFLLGEVGASATYGMGESSEWLIYGVIGGVLGFFIAEMFIRKTVKVLRHWKGALLFAGCFLLVTCSLIFDFFGYGRYVLPEGRVESIYLSMTDRPSEHALAWKVSPMVFEFSGENMDAALALQKFIAQEGRRGNNTGVNYLPIYMDYPSPYPLEIPADIPADPPFPSSDGLTSPYYRHTYSYESRYFHLYAKLTDGRIVQRRYYVTFPYGSPEWHEKIGALYEAARPQSLERLQNIGAAARRLELQIRIPPKTDVGEFYHEDYTLLYRQDIADLIGMMLVDNREAPHWEEDEIYYQYNTAWYISIRAVIGDDRTYYPNSLWMRVDGADENALRWLYEKGYIPRLPWGGV